MNSTEQLSSATIALPEFRPHFYVPKDSGVSPEIDFWDPDEQPALHANSFGHYLLEPYVRIRRAGYPATIGSRTPPNATVLLVHARTWSRSHHSPIAAAALKRPTVLIRADANIGPRTPFGVDYDLMPNAYSCLSKTQIYLPPFPQRGLIRRTPGEQTSQRLTIAYKGSKENLPDSFMDADLISSLSEMGCVLRFDFNPDHTQGLGAPWHDFETVDFSLCVRAKTGPLTDFRKPATKLINAWAAGVIPLIGRELAYLELAKPGLDSLIVEKGSDLLTIIEGIRSGSFNFSALLDHATSRGLNYSSDAVCDQWIQKLISLKKQQRHPSPLLWSAQLSRALLRDARLILRK